jgi:hypothetical protein
VQRGGIMLPAEFEMSEDPFPVVLNGELLLRRPPISGPDGEIRS